MSNIHEEDVGLEGIMRLIEGILLEVLDKCSISGKWYPRDISLKTLEEKKRILQEMNRWLKGDKWPIWTDIYCDYYVRNQRTIHKNYLRIRNKSIRYVNKRIKEKKLQLKNEEAHAKI